MACCSNADVRLPEEFYGLPSRLGPSFKKGRYTEHVAQLAAACDWLGIDRGRAARYGELIRELFEDDARCREHILAFSESCEVVDLFELWEARVTEFPGLAERMRAVLRKGPLLREEENPAAPSNRPRNDAFGYLGRSIGVLYITICHP